MQIYIEYVILDNLVIDYLLLKATFLIKGKKVKTKRLFLSAVLGAVIAVIYPLLSDIKLIYLFVKILSGLLVILTATKYDSFREFYISVLMFFLLTFLTGGAIIAVFSILGLNYSAETSIALMIIPSYLVIRVVTEAVRYVYRQKNVINLCYDVEIKLNAKVYSARGFLDTGNGLYVDDGPVIVIEKNFAKKILGDFHGVKLNRINVGTVSGETLNLSFKIDGIKIYKKEGVNIYNNVTVCVSSKPIGDGYEVILHPDLMENKRYEDDAFKIKEVS